MITLKQGDTRHAIRATLQTDQGVPVDLTGATVRFDMKHYLKDLMITKSADVQTGGVVEVVFNSPETDLPGTYNAEFVVVYADERTETFPSSGYIEVKIEKRVGGVL